jgi:hypothetical protein
MIGVIWGAVAVEDNISGSSRRRKGAAIWQ